MEHIAAVLLIVACSGNLEECRELPAPVPLFETSEDCDTERSLAVGTYDTSSERVLATCVAIDPALEEENAEIVWDVEDGRLVALIEIPDAIVASNSDATGDSSVMME